MKTQPFKYPDTNSSRAQIEFLSERFSTQKIAIIGMGGTGSYILDLVSKTPVREIHIFDGDIFQLHNAFRAPGAIEGCKLDAEMPLKKVGYYASVYSNMHNGIVPHDGYITKQNVSQLTELDFVFICVDKNSVRNMIVTSLVEMNVQFIDVGLGVNIVDNSLIGSLRVTVGSEGKNDHIANRIGGEELAENAYSTNIQIADLNCLNAVLAVIKWKKIAGFYQSLKDEHNILFFINTNRLLNEDFAA